MNYKILKADISKSKLEELLGALEGSDCIEITYAPASKTQVLQMCIPHRPVSARLFKELTRFGQLPGGNEIKSGQESAAAVLPDWHQDGGR
jgi:hypothetical protein